MAFKAAAHRASVDKLKAHKEYKKVNHDHIH